MAIGAEALMDGDTGVKVRGVLILLVPQIISICELRHGPPSESE
jgi:hypothetical protein